MHRSPALHALMLATLLGASAPAMAAESYDSCTGFIDSVPAVIGTQGTWCLRKDLATAMSIGSAITINTSNVTLDCNRFKLGGLAAGPATQAMGVRAIDRANVTVRGCNLRGFNVAISLEGQVSSGHVIEDNLLEGITNKGMLVNGDGSVIRRNRLLDTGGATAYPGFAMGIVGSGSIEVSDNVIAGVAPLENESGIAVSYGIYIGNATGVPIRDNQVRGLVIGSAGGNSYGVAMYQSQAVDVRGNLLAGPFSFGVSCNDASSLARDNFISQASIVPVSLCSASGNLP